MDLYVQTLDAKFFIENFYKKRHFQLLFLKKGDKTVETLNYIHNYKGPVRIVQYEICLFGGYMLN